MLCPLFPLALRTSFAVGAVTLPLALLCSTLQQTATKATTIFKARIMKVFGILFCMIMVFAEARLLSSFLPFLATRAQQLAQSFHDSRSGFLASCVPTGRVTD